MKKDCRTCSKCCNSDESKVRLTPQDIFLFSYQLKLNPSEIVYSFCEVNIDDGFPNLWLKGRCPFKNNTTCASLQKPLVCSYYPNGNAIWFNEKFEILCMKCDYNDDYESYLNNDHFYSKWKQATAICSMLINGKGRESKRLELSDLALKLIFLQYDVSKPFLKQFDDNVLTFIQYATKDSKIVPFYSK